MGVQNGLRPGMLRASLGKRVNVCSGVNAEMSEPPAGKIDDGDSIMYALHFQSPPRQLTVSARLSSMRLMRKLAFDLDLCSSP
jgi:hypothetical protein